MHQHGDYEKSMQRWFCNYWMTLKEWNSIHNYLPHTNPLIVSHDETDYQLDDSKIENEDF
jgi:hypothetical protein